MQRTGWARLCLAAAFIINSVISVPVVRADVVTLPAPGALIHLSPAFSPTILRGIKVYPHQPLKFDFILDKGDGVDTPSLTKEGEVGRLQRESTQLVKYFLASLTVPEKDLWVNLSPYEKDRIVADAFGKTEMGRDLLAQDYLLKQMTASLIYPEGETGKQFWNKVYTEAAKRYGNTDVSVNTFNKVWIMPEKAVVYENAKAGTAYVVESKLKVMLEEDYLAQKRNREGARDHSPSLTKRGLGGVETPIIREIIIPQLTKEVNEGRNFAQLRQIYNSLILAAWYKKKIKDSVLAQVYADKNRIEGVRYTRSVKDSPADRALAEAAPRDDREIIYRRYLEAFKKGVYNYVKEEIDISNQKPIPRKYFSGGMEWTSLESQHVLRVTDEVPPAAAMIDRNQAMIAPVNLNPVGGGGIALPPSIGAIKPAANGKSTEAPRIQQELNSDYLLFIEAEYGYLPADHAAQRFVERRLKTILPGVPERDLPRVFVLGARGMGINAFVTPEASVYVTPELLEFIQYEEELDGVLLHEFNHVAQQHFQQMHNSIAGGTVIRSLGLTRYTEYEADTLAFYQAQDARRKTSPQGLLTFFERLRSRGANGWDIAHGDINDRILNLKLLSRMLDINGLEKPLTPVATHESGAIAALGKLPVRLGISKIINSMPYDGETTPLEQWKSKIRQSLLNSSWKYKQVLLRRIYQEMSKVSAMKGIKLQTQQRRMAILKDVMDGVYASWSEAFERDFESLSEAERNLLKALLLEAGSGIPVISHPEDWWEAQAPGLDGAAHRLRSMRSLKLLKDGARLLGEGRVRARITDPIAGMYVEGVGTLRAVLGLTALSMGENAEYDQPQGIDLKGYVDDVGILVGAFIPLVDSRHAVDFQAYRNDLGNRLWTAAAFSAAEVLEDLGGSDEAFTEEFQRKPYEVAAEVFEDLLGQKEASIEAQYPNPSQHALREQAQESTGNIRAFAIRQNILLPLTGLQMVEEKIRLLGRNARTWDHERTMEALHEIKILMDNMRPHDRESTSLLGTLAMLEENRLNIALRDFIEWAQAISVDEEEYKRWMEVTSLYLTADMKLSDFEEITRFIEHPPASNAFGQVRFQHVDARVELIIDWQVQLLHALNKELDATQDGRSFFEQLALFVRRWPIPKAEGFIPSMDTAIFEEIVQLENRILSKGVAFLRPLSAQKDQTYFYDLFVLNFFTQNTINARAINSYVLPQLIEQMPFMQAAHIVLEDFIVQRFVGDLRTLELLDEKAETEEDLEYLRNAWLRIRAQGLNDPFHKSGQLVLGDGVLFKLVQEADPLPLLLALLGAEHDDTQLKKTVMGVWWAAYGGFIMEDIRQDLEPFDSLEELKAWEAARPGIYQKPLSQVMTDFDDNEPGTFYRPFSSVVNAIYTLGPMERYVLVRKLLVGVKGILNNPNQRQALLDELFKLYVDSAKDPQLVDLLKEVLAVLLRSASVDDAYFVLAPILGERIANPPAKPSSNEGLARQKAIEVVNRNPLIEESIEKIIAEANKSGEEDSPGIDPQVYAVNMIKKKMHRYLSDAGNASGDPLMELIPSLPAKDTRLEPIQVVLDAARQLGTPGVRFLQLLGQTVDIPEEYRQGFTQVYDDVRGQTKVAAMETIKARLPEYAKRIKRFVGKRIGGGSMYTVFRVEVVADQSDYPERVGQVVEEVVRVLNPNALYHTRHAIDIIRRTLEALADEKLQYRQALPLVDMLEQWIQQELADTAFEDNDPVFRKKWSGQSSSRGAGMRIYVPVSIPTGTNYVRREEYVPEVLNLKDINQLPAPQAKAAAALAAQHYLAQIQGSWNKFIGAASSGSIVHSDISVGNLGLQRRPDGTSQLVIFDRGNYLMLDRPDRNFLNQLSKAGSVQESVAIFIRHLWEFGENRQVIARLDQKQVIDDIVRALEPYKREPEILALRLRIEVGRYQLQVPLKDTLLFKNFNALNRIAKSAGFASLEEALAYKRSQDAAMAADTASDQAAADDLGGIDLTSDQGVSVVNDGQGITFQTDRALLKQLAHVKGFEITVKPLYMLPDLSGFLGLPN